MTALDELTSKALEAKKGETVPSYVIARTDFDDTGTADLMHCVVTWLTLHGHIVDRSAIKRSLRRTGRPAASTIQIGVEEFHLLTIINGKCVFIALVNGKGLRRVQYLKTKKRVEQSGAFFWVIGSFEEFLKEYKLITKNHEWSEQSNPGGPCGQNTGSEKHG